MRRRFASACPPSQGGFTYIGLLILVALIGIALAGTAEVVSTAIQRDREQELLFIGNAYAEALDSYRKSSPGQQRFPTKLEELVADSRFPNVRRHIRRLYNDPMTQSSDWGLVLGPNNGIVGVYSKSERRPLKQANFPPRYDEFAGSKQYREWEFLARSMTDAGEDSASYDAGAARRAARGQTGQDGSGAAPGSNSGFGAGTGDDTENKSPFDSDEEGTSEDKSPFGKSPFTSSFGADSQGDGDNNSGFGSGFGEEREGDSKTDSWSSSAPAFEAP